MFWFYTLFISNVRLAIHADLSSTARTSSMASRRHMYLTVCMWPRSTIAHIVHRRLLVKVYTSFVPTYFPYICQWGRVASVCVLDIASHKIMILWLISFLSAQRIIHIILYIYFTGRQIKYFWAKLLLSVRFAYN
jgi:hypothetical protein